MHPFCKFSLLLPWKSLPPDLSISPWRCCSRRCICKQVGTLWRQTQYRTICGPPLLPFSSLSIPHFKAERLRWRFGKKWKTNCSFVSGWRPDTWANSPCVLSSRALRWSRLKLGCGGARKRRGPSNCCFKVSGRQSNVQMRAKLVNDHLRDKSAEILNTHGWRRMCAALWKKCWIDVLFTLQ